MTFSKKNFIYSVGIYYLEGHFYVVGLVRLPPLGLSIEVLPIYKVKGNNIEQLAHAIESARLGSDAQYPPKQSNLERQKWNGENEHVWNTATHAWSVYWEENGSVSLDPKTRIKHKDGVEWRFVPEREKVLLPPVSSHDIAQEILNQL